MIKSISHFFTAPAASSHSLAQKLSILVASFITMLVVSSISFWLKSSFQPLILVASIGASIMLVFVLPNSPVSQPYALLTGHVISAAVGVSCAYLPFEIYINASLCIVACTFAMFLLDCIHPPAGATAMMPVIVGAEAVGGYSYIVFPVLINMLILVALGIIFHRWWLAQEYPSRKLPDKDPLHQHDDLSPLARLGIDKTDLAESLKEFNAFLNVTDKDLVEIYGMAQQKAYTRRFGEIRCLDIMSKDVKTVTPDTELEEAWALLRLHKEKLLPVVDEHRNVIGIISLVDFLKRAGLKHYDGFAERLVRFIKHDPKLTRSGTTDKPKKVSQIMATPAFTVNQHDLIATLVPVLSDKGLHHIPVTNDNNQVVGIVTQSDLIAALYTGAMNA